MTEAVSDLRRKAEEFGYLDRSQIVRKFLSDNDLTGVSGAEDVEKLCRNSESVDDKSLEGTGLTISDAKQILTDLDRTFPDHPQFSGPAETKGKLCRILCIYVMYNPTVGYCQGMGYIAGVVLMYNKDEEEAFWITAALFESDKYLSGLYSKDLQRVKQYGRMFEKMLKDKRPNLHDHLSSMKIHPLIYLTRWFMCLYTTLPCWETVLFIWSQFMDKGVPVLFQSALSIMELLQSKMLAMDRVEELIPFMQNPPVDMLAKQKFASVFETSSLSGDEMEVYFSEITRDESFENICLPSSRKRELEDTDGSAMVEEVSLFQRVVNTFTPAKRKRGYGHTPARTPATVQEATRAIQKSTPFVTKSSVKRKRATSSKRKHRFSDEGMEMKDMTGTPRLPTMKTPYDFSPFAQSPLSLDFTENASPLLTQSKAVSLRRSVRLKGKYLADLNDEDSTL
jgi:hypothetical protein